MFKKLTDDAILPQAQTELSAGYDVYANEDIEIHAGQTKVVSLGISLDEATKSLKGYYFGLYLRSSFGVKGLILPNGVGIIDFDYEGEIKQIIHNSNFEKGVFKINKGDRVGQLILHKHYGHVFMKNKYRKDTKRDGGLGSSGSK